MNNISTSAVSLNVQNKQRDSTAIDYRHVINYYNFGHTIKYYLRFMSKDGMIDTDHY